MQIDGIPGGGGGSTSKDFKRGTPAYWSAAQK